ncbi:hypothetical protein [Limnobacter parvus]|uniref:Uncharacterized protein n=1 Tax=Limnobacter parvus TaxID=2939690 RepID=A0ABT1XDQ7_9BURK|nr:hypothetical protein [Limnobacter parvus]MCR2745415.1 hypothetical protein [Limnobacter parvus]
MKNFIDSVVRTPGVLFMAMLTTGFTINAGVQYINATGFEGPNLLAAACLVVGQVALVVVHQMRRFGQDNKLTLQ